MLRSRQNFILHKTQNFSPTLKIGLHFFISIWHSCDFFEQRESRSYLVHFLLCFLFRIIGREAVVSTLDNDAPSFDNLCFSEVFGVLIGSKSRSSDHFFHSRDALIVLAIRFVGQGEIAEVSCLRVGQRLFKPLSTMALLYVSIA